MAIKFHNNDNDFIEEDETIKLTEYAGSKNAKLSKTYQTSNNLKDYQKLNSKEYYDKKEKKKKKYKIREYRTTAGIQNSMKKVKSYLLHNFDGSSNELFLTLTYEHPMNDMEKLKKDYDYFWKRLKKQYKDLEYLYVVEMQEERKSLHLHVLLKNINHKELFIPFEILAKLWNKGYIWVSQINKEDTENLVIEDNKNEKTAIGRVIKYMVKLKSKRYVPKNKNIYSKSKGIVAPPVREMTLKEAKQFFYENDYEFHYSYSGDFISTKSGLVVGSVKGKVYRKKKKKKE